MTYGSNEGLYYPDEEVELNLRTGTPWQKRFEKVDVKHKKRWNEGMNGHQKYLSSVNSGPAVLHRKAPCICDLWNLEQTFSGCS